MTPPTDFEAFAASRWTTLVRSGWLLTGDWQRAEDLTQAALARVWRHWRRVATADDPDRYARKVLVNEFLRDRHRWRRHKPLPEGDAGRSSEGPENAVSLRDELARSLRALPPGQRAVLVLRYYLDLSEQDIATTLGCSAGNVKSQAARGLARLREVHGRGDAVTQKEPS